MRSTGRYTYPVRAAMSATISHPDRSLWWRTPGTKVGLAICYDRRYPETCRELMKKGARLILISISSSIMPGGFSELPVFETELKTRAFENQLFLAACNRSGQEGEYTFFGHSMLLGPDGSVLAQADEAENVVVLAEMELEDADRARINGPLLRDRRPELYTC